MEAEVTTPASVAEVVSELVIPSVRGEFYSYNPGFSTAKPLYCLCKCKSNKNWPVDAASRLGREIDLLFVFENKVWVCSPNAIRSARLLRDFVRSETLNQTVTAVAEITEAAFYDLRRQKDGAALVQLYDRAEMRCCSNIAVSPGAVLAVRTDSRKYGAFLVKEVTASSILIDACHIQL